MANSIGAHPPAGFDTEFAALIAGGLLILSRRLRVIAVGDLGNDVVTAKARK